MGHSYVPRNPRGQQRDKIYREALRLELADMSEGVDLKKLRQIARAHIEKAASGDMQAIKELADRLDGRPAQSLDLGNPDRPPPRKIINEIVHVYETPEQLAAEMAAVEMAGEAEEEPVIEWHKLRDGNGGGANGSGGLNGNGCDRDRR
jgi:hypothetical protein